MASRPRRHKKPRPSDQAPASSGKKTTAQIEDIGALIEPEIPRLRRYARMLVRNAAYADDLVQECLLRAVSRIDSWTPGTNLRAWMFTILHNVYVNEVRRATRMPLASDTSEGSRSLETVANQDERLRLRDLDRAFNQLSDDHRQVILLIGIEGLQYEEAAAVLDVPVGTVRSRLSRAREALRSALEGQP
jgi:RNA polymerase sigma-70 factor (ECF subfamily)